MFPIENTQPVAITTKLQCYIFHMAAISACFLPLMSERATRKRYPLVQGKDDHAHKLITEKIAESELLFPKICWTVLWLLLYFDRFLIKVNNKLLFITVTIFIAVRNISIKNLSNNIFNIIKSYINHHIF